MAQTETYCIWAGVMQRCFNPNDSGYELYGGRGITVCERWHDFEMFFADMGERPDGMSLDRYPDRNGDYEPSNCRWATLLQQSINTDRVDHAVGVRRKGSRFYARIRRWGRNIHVGVFDTEVEAVAARRALKEKLDAQIG
jgi:hypothetical protein